MRLALVCVFKKKYLAKIYSRSGLSPCTIKANAGVIDSDFRGNIKVVLHNHADVVAEFEPGGRTTQVVSEKVESPPI